MTSPPKSLFEKKLLLMIGCVIYAALFCWGYINILVPLNSYYGLIYVEPSLRDVWIVSIFALIPVSYLPIDIDKPSKLVIWLIYIIAYIPICFVRAFWGIADMNAYYLFLFYVCFGLFLVRMITLFPQFKIKRIPVSGALFNGVIFFLFLIINLLVLSNFGFIAKIVSLSEVYAQREQYKTTLGDMGNYLAYLIPICSNTLNIYFLSNGLIRKNYLLTTVAILSQLIIFSITGLKSVLFSIPFTFIIFYFFTKVKPQGLQMLKVFIYILIGIIFLNFLNIFDSSANLFLRRFMTMQGQLTSYYFDFFSTHPKCYLGYSFLKKMSSYRYLTPPSEFIGFEYLGREGMHANVNFFADAFSNFGVVGIMLYSLLLGLILWIYDSISKQLDLKIACILASVFALNVINTSLLISFVTHGFLFTIAFSYFFPTQELKLSHE